MEGNLPTPLDPHDPLVERAMKVIEQLSPAERDELDRTVYRYVYAYRRTKNPRLLIELVNGAIATVALRENSEYKRALTEFPATQSPEDTGGTRRATENERRAG